ncbi:AAA family ATPase [Candidatus Uhrbacteria bacterium]|jgi:chromosome segregation protein|nr:AAA family ATPase [Candidatus Uhrbacteria bacterium]
MHLQRLELQGFKTFAKKTSLDFSAPSKDRHALTVIVGPNGSGKSNIADAIRWCLGEQSMKMLRGKKSEDIIFSGSEGKGRSGMAEVTMTINNSDKAMPVDYIEVVITRRLYRDGQSEYLLNGKAVRLSDIQLLLAQAGVGQRTYSVVGQGMIDHVLTASPEERKIFFDDATGVRGLQIKRHQAMLKLQKASDNLAEVEMLLAEISPRLRSLKRQVKRLEKREVVEVELKEIQNKYFGGLWSQLQIELSKADTKLESIEKRIAEKQKELKDGDKQLLELEKQSSKEDKSKLRAKAHDAYKKAQAQLQSVRQEQFEAERALELAKVKAQSNWAPLPLSNILDELKSITTDQEQALKDLKSVKDIDALTKITDAIENIFKRAKQLRGRLTKPNPEDFKPDKAMLKVIADSKDKIKKAQVDLKAAEAEMDQANKQDGTDKTEIFSFQRKLREIQSELHQIENQSNQLNIEKVRVETRIEGLEREMREEVPERIKEIKNTPSSSILSERSESKDLLNLENLRSKMLDLKHKLELIGGIDEETVTEFEETKERHDFLDVQVSDIREAIQKSEKVIDELDSNIQSQSEKVFKQINKEFQKYFKILFGGGSCGLIKMKQDEVEKENKITLDRAMEALAQDQIEEIEEDENSVSAIMKRVKKRKDHVAGIEIQATPPGKRLKSLNLLSGGERALTSIALLSAIMATNPSPFVVLDEVDAALDEANTVRFANILDELQKLTQFIVVTHNRATMEHADLLYGVSMGDDGVSNLLSVSLSDVEKNGTARR